MIRTLFAAASIALPLTANADPSFLAASETVKQIADGKSWTGTRKAGKAVRMTINADKTFVFDGPMTIEDAWYLRGEELCLQMGMFLGDKCLRFAPVDNGFEVYEDGKLAFTLKRP